MIILITGQPGSGKTAHAVDLLAHDPQFQNRPKFVMGVPDLAIEHEACPPVEQWTEKRKSPEDVSVELAYFTFPESSVVLLDEAQRIYRPRPVGSAVPAYVAAFETHRHTGVDFILITQHAGLIDSNIRKLVGRHIHIRVTPFGRYRYEWTELGDPESSSSRQLAAKEKYQLPKRSFDLYKSSQLHTRLKVKIPFFAYIFAVAAVATIGLGTYAYQRVTSKAEPIKTISADTLHGSEKPTSNKNEPITPEQYLDMERPRVPGLLHTAPKYDEVTKPTEPPWPSGCYVYRDTCKCLSQQGTKYETTQAICRSIVKDGIYKDFAIREAVPPPSGT